MIRQAMALVGHIILIVIIFLIQIRGSSEPVKSASIFDVYNDIAKKNSHYLPLTKSKLQINQLAEQLHDLRSLAKDSRIYIVHYHKPESLPHLPLDICFAETVKQIEKFNQYPDTAKETCKKYKNINSSQTQDQIIVHKKTKKNVIVLFLSDTPVNYSFADRPSNIKMLYFSGPANSQLYNTSIIGYPVILGTSYSLSSCQICSQSLIPYFKDHLTDEEIKKAVLVYFNKPVYKIITMTEPSQVYLQ